jgi:L-fuconolactonase
MTKLPNEGKNISSLSDFSLAMVNQLVVQPLRPPRTQRIDAHHHLWHFHKAEFAWINDTMAALRRDFLIEDLCHALHSAKIDASVAVQARQTLEETQWLLECAETTPAICGVVGWVPLTADHLSALLDRFMDHEKLAGFREIVQSEPDGYLDRADFNRGIAQLAARNLTYDLLIHERQLEEATRFVDRHPQQIFVLDHAAKPCIAGGELEPWRSRLREFAKRENVCCKISGLVTEADWLTWTLEGLRPYLDSCVEAFGPERLLAGSDWPVCLVASSYPQWWSVLTDYFASFSDHEVQRIFGGNAIDCYRLTALSPSQSEVSS